MKTQKELILKYLKSGKRMTGIEGLKYASTMKVSSRIGEMEKAGLFKGYKLMRDWYITRSGKKVRMYWLNKEGR